MLVPVTQHSDLMFFYISKWLPDSLYVSYLWLIYLATGSLCLLIPLIYFFLLPNTLTSFWQPPILCIYNYVSVLLFRFLI